VNKPHNCLEENMHGLKSARILILVFLGVMTVAGTVNAQILNTLRGWANPEEGLSLEMNGRLSYAKGNSNHLRFTARASAQFITGANRFLFMISNNLKSTDGEKSAEDFKIHLRHNYRLTSLFSTLMFVQNQYNPYKRLKQRSLFGAGVRADIFRTSNCQGALGASLMLESIELTDDPEEGSSTDTRASFFVSLIWRPTEIVRVDLSGFYQPFITDFNDPLILMELNVLTYVSDALGITTSLEYSYDGDPPEDVEDTDIELSSGLIFSL